MWCKRAVEPDLFLWQNIGISKMSRIIRTIIFCIFSILILIICFYAILQLENWIQSTEVNFPSFLSCAIDVSQADAITDYKNFVNKNSSF